MAGNVYVADTDNNRVRRIDPAGTITTVAGTGAPGYSGDGGPATAAWLFWPHAVAVDAASNLYVTDTINQRVRRIDPAGVITTVAGTGERGYSGDGGPATEARLGIPVGVAADPEGNVYVSDIGNHRIRLVSGVPYEVPVRLGSSGETRWLAVSSRGDVTLGGRTAFAGIRVATCNGDVYALHNTADGGLQARYVAERQAVPLEGLRPITLTRDESGSWRIGDETVVSGHRHAQDGREFVLDVADGRWRLASHRLRTVGGHSSVQDGVSATSARLYTPSSVALDSQGNLYIADQSNNRIRRIDISGTITTFAGTGEKGYRGDGGPAAEAVLNGPSGVAVDDFGDVYVADTGNHRVRRIDVNGTIGTYAGTGVRGYSGDGSWAASARLDTPVAVATDAAGRVYIADYGNRRVRRVDLANTIETYAGPGNTVDWGDSGLATDARLDGPGGVAADTAGNVYVADYLGRRIRRIDPAGVISTVPGTDESGSGGDGAADAALLVGPADVAVDPAGNVYVADYLGRRIRRIDPAGVTSTVAGTGEAGYGGDGGAADAAPLDGPAGVAADAAGNVYVADLSNHRIRRIDASGNISTVAGTGEPFDRGDGGRASEGRFSREIGAVAVDASGNVYVADSFDHTVRRIDAAETVSTLAGTGRPGFGMDNETASEAQLNTPAGVAVDAVGNVYVADTGNHRVLRIEPVGTIAMFAGTGEAGYSGLGLPADSSPLNRPERVAVGTDGTVYVLDAGNRRVRAISPAGWMRSVAGNGFQDSPHLAGLFNGSDAESAPLLGAFDLAVGPARAGRTGLHLALGAPAATSRLWTIRLPDGRIEERFEGRSGALGAVARGRDGTVFFADGTAIHEIAPDGSVSTVVDLGEYGISVGGLAVDDDGRIWFSDPEGRRVRVLEPVEP